jgi:hypothetical protein
MRATALKLSSDQSEIDLAVGHFGKSDYYWPIDRAAHQGAIDELVTSKEPTLPLTLIAAIESSRRLLKLGPDWDDAGAKPIEFDTWTEAIRLLKNAVVNVGDAIDVPMPNISPCRDGSIDLFWKTVKFTLLINIKPAFKKSDFFGETDDGLVFEGSFNRNTRHFGVVLRALAAKE